MHARERATERGLDRREAQIDVERAVARVHAGEPFRRLERPDVLRIQEDEVLLPPRDHTERPRATLRATRHEPAEALLDALFAEGLEEVVDHAEVERLERVLLERARDDEHRRPGRVRHRADQIETGPRIAGPGELDVYENDVDGRALQRLTRLVEAGDGTDDFREVRVMDQLDEIVARRPLVLEHQRFQHVSLTHGEAPPRSSASPRARTRGAASRRRRTA